MAQGLHQRSHNRVHGGLMSGVSVSVIHQNFRHIAPGGSSPNSLETVFEANFRRPLPFLGSDHSARLRVPAPGWGRRSERKWAPAAFSPSGKEGFLQFLLVGE